MVDFTGRTGKGQDSPNARRNLRLVQPKPPQNQGDPRKGRGRHYLGSTFTPEEEARIRVALRNARPLFGTWDCLAAAMRVAPKTPQEVAAGRTGVSGDMAVRLARALGKPLEALLRAPTDASRCVTCGASRCGS